MTHQIKGIVNCSFSTHPLTRGHCLISIKDSYQTHSHARCNATTVTGCVTGHNRHTLPRDNANAVTTQDMSRLSCWPLPSPPCVALAPPLPAQLTLWSAPNQKWGSCTNTTHSGPACTHMHTWQWRSTPPPSPTPTPSPLCTTLHFHPYPRPLHSPQHN